MNCTLPLVTVGVPCYNHARFVADSLDSIRAQEYANMQLIIVDDKSSDDSVNVIEKWIRQHQAKVEFIKHGENQGICRTLNEMVSLAKGKYIAWLSSDDVWLPQKLREHVEMLERLPEAVGVVYSDAYQISEDGGRLPEMFIATQRQLLLPPEGRIFDALVEGNFIPGMTTLIRTRCFETVGGYDESLNFEDWEMWLRISQHFDFVFSKIPSALYRIVETSLFRSRQKDIQTSVDDIYIRLLRKGFLKGRRRRWAAATLLERGLHWRERDFRRSVALVFEALRWDIRPRNLAACLTITLGFKASAFRWLVSVCRTLKSTCTGIFVRQSHK
jgi:glycosyltransferase involved in cell wall biosynthesis